MKLCYDCIHIDISSGWGGTNVTPGDVARLRCSKHHWDLFDSMYSGSGPELKDCLTKAEHCPDFTNAEHINLNDQIVP